MHTAWASDFSVLEDGRAQDISDFGVEETPFAAAVLMDTSGSMRDRMSLARSAAIRFLDGLRPNDVAAVYRFATEVELVQDFSSSRDLAPLVYGLQAKGMTALNEAILRAAEALGQRPEKRRAIVILSDGYNESAGTSASKALDRALAVGARLKGNLASWNRAHIFWARLDKNFASKTVAVTWRRGGPGLREAFALSSKS